MSISFSLDRTLTGYGRVFDVALNPDKTLVAVAKSDDEVIILDATNNYSVVATIADMGDIVISLAFSPDGSQMAAGSNDSNVYIYNTNDFSTPAETLTEAGGFVRAVDYRSDGEQLATVSSDNHVRVYDTSDYTLIDDISLTIEVFCRLAYRPNSTHLAVAPGTNDVVIYDTSNFTVVETLTEATNLINAVSYSPDGNYLATGGRESTVRLYLASDYSLHATGSLGGGRIADTAFDATSQVLFVSGRNPDDNWFNPGRTRAYDVSDDLNILDTFDFSGNEHVAVDSGSVYIGTRDGDLRIYDIETAEPPVAEPNVTTQAASSVGKTTATLNGELTDLGEETDVDGFFEYRVQGAGTWETTTPQNLSATGTFDEALTDLDPDTTYEFRAVVTWDSGSERAEGSTLTFTTDSLDSPAVTTQAVTDIDKTTATANGNVTDLGEEASVEAGHQFRIKNVETPNAWTNTATQSLSATGAYTTSLTALDPDTTYEVRSRITWDSGAEEEFGSIEEFTTDPLDAPTVTTQAATSVGSGGATLNGDVTSKGDFDPVDARFQYRETGSGTWLETSLATDVATGAYTFELTGLTPETEYEFRAKAEYDTDQEVFGGTLTFTTLAGNTAPSVTTNAMTEIRATYATANGNVTSDGGETVTERGFVWATTTAPDVTDNKVEVAGTTGVYSVKLTALPPETLIYLRTYAINSEGTSYGNEVSFTTLSLEDVRNPVYIKDGDNLRRIA